MAQLPTGWERQTELDPPEEQLQNAIEASGLSPKRPVRCILDGKVHRFAVAGDKNTEKAGWYIGFGDNIPAGIFGSWRGSIEEKWRGDTGRIYTPEETAAYEARLVELQAIHEAERRKRYEQIASAVQKIIAGAPQASPENAYLARKRVGVYSIYQTGDGRLIVPVIKDGTVVSAQYIEADGSKQYHGGGEVKGGYFPIGPLPPQGPLYIAEGYATAASVYEATGCTTIAALSAGNIMSVASWLREKLGAVQDITIVGDNDDTNTGQKAAKEAGTAIGARVIIPPDLGDANDYVNAGGDLKLLLTGRAPWLTQADEFCAKPAPIRWLVKKWIQTDGLAMVFGDSGAGKAQPLDEPVLTPSGWKPMGEIKPGDYVIGSKGFPVAVENVYPQGVKDVWEVEFSNGEVVRCCKDHLWEVKTSSEPRSKILTTAELQHKPHRSYWQVPLCSPVSYARNYNPLPIDPYLLGCLLGDGGITAYVGFSSNDAFIVDEIKKRLPAGHEIRNKTGCDYQITSQRGQPNHIWTALRLLGLAGKTSEKKIVPDEYMVASPQDRLELLQGLMDTDGYVSAGNGTTCDFSNSSLILVEQVKELVQSLGGIANSIRCKKTSGLNCYTVTFRMQKGIIPFLLPRKAKRCCFNGNNLIIRVIDVRKTDKQAEMQCISLLSQDELYVTRGFIVTHNTFVVLDWVLRMAAGIENWAGLRVRPGGVVYLAGEGHHGLKARIAGWKKYYQAEHLNMWISGGACDLNTTEGLAHTVSEIRALEAQNIAVIVVDTLHRFLNGDENKAVDAKTMLDSCAVLQETFGCSVILVHHTGTAQDAKGRARGSSSWRGALDNQILVTASGDGVKLEQVKQKDSELAPPIYLQRTPVNLPGWFDEDGQAISTIILEPDAHGSEKETQKLNKTQHFGLQTYREAAETCGLLDERGKFAGVRESDWREFFYRRCESKNQETKRKNFQRVRSELLEKKELTCECDVYMLSDDYELECVYIARELIHKRDISGFDHKTADLNSGTSGTKNEVQG